MAKRWTKQLIFIKKKYTHPPDQAKIIDPIYRRPLIPHNSFNLICPIIAWQKIQGEARVLFMK